MSIQHENPSHDNDPVASAPYNFVPLAANDVVVKAADTPRKLPPHDKYDASRHTGYFDAMLTTRSPLYVRCALGRDAQGSNEEKAKFFHKRSGNVPVIPGSSLRGMLRSIVEIASYGKFNRVTDRRLFYRDIRNRELYTSNFVQESSGTVSSGFNWITGAAYSGKAAKVYSSRTKVGFIVAVGRQYNIEQGIVGRIDMPTLTPLLGVNLYERQGANKIRPFWEVTLASGPERVQYRDIWVDLDSTEMDYFFQEQPGNYAGSPPRHHALYLKMRMARNPSLTAVAGKTKGTLVLTGPMQNQHLAFVFFRKEDLDLAGFINTSGLTSIGIPDSLSSGDPNGQLWERFHEDQLTQWQEGAFPANRNGINNPTNKGYLCDGDPVFYLTESIGGIENLSFFGRASLFRLPYKTRPIDLIPLTMVDDQVVDYADALFGYVRDKKTEQVAEAGEPERAFAGRVCVTEARLIENQRDIWLSSTPQTPRTITPRILSSPKPTSYQHYLTQNASSYHMGYGRTLFHYDSNQGGHVKTQLRGHKIYWHQGWQQTGFAKTDQDWFETIRETSDDIGEGDTQHTRLNPVKPDVTFKFRVYFENLSCRELGALCWAMNPAPETKKDYCHKLGMGKPLGMGSVKLSSELTLTDRTARYSSLFSGDRWDVGSKETITEADAIKAFERHILDEIHPQRDCKHLSDMKRIGMFLRLMEFTDNSGFADAMSLDDFKRRPVLPNPAEYDHLSGNVLEVRSLSPLTDASKAVAARQTNRFPELVEPTSTGAAAVVQKDPPIQQDNYVEDEPVQHREGMVKGLWVNIVRSGKAGKYVVTVEGEIEEFTIEISYKMGDRCRCDVTYQKGKAVGGKFKGWS